MVDENDWVENTYNLLEFIAVMIFIVSSIKGKLPWYRKRIIKMLLMMMVMVILMNCLVEWFRPAKVR